MSVLLNNMFIVFIVKSTVLVKYSIDMYEKILIVISCRSKCPYYVSANALVFAVDYLVFKDFYKLLLDFILILLLLFLLAHLIVH